MTKDIKKYDFKEGLPQEFEILDLTTLYRDSKEILTTIHRIGFYQIVWFQEGSPTHFVDFKPIQTKPNTLLFLNKESVQQFDNTTKFGGKIILFTDSFFCKTELDTKFLKNNYLFNDFFPISHFQITDTLNVFTELHNQMQQELHQDKDDIQPDILKNLLHLFLLHSERERRNQNRTEIKKGADLDYLMLFKELLETNFKKEKQVNFYAKQLLITEKRFNQVTSKILGKSPKQIIDDRVLLEAKRILVHSTESSKEIAYYLGFEEPTNFIKYFKKHVSLTPKEFREKHTLA